MTTDVPRRGMALRLTVVTLVVLAGLAVLCALGAWQLQRKAWKEDLLARIAALQTAPPEPLSVVLNRAADPAAPGGPKPSPRSLDFTRVQTLCDGLPGRGLHLYGLQASGPGWRQIAACTLPPGLPYRTLLVDLGFERLPPVSPPALQAVTLPAREASVVGVLRTPDAKAWTDGLIATPTPTDVNGQWMRRNVPAMAGALHAPDPAPFMLELETPAAGPGLIPSPLPSDIPNSHLGYAITWFGLALALAGVYVAFVLRSMRARAGKA